MKHSLRGSIFARRAGLAALLALTAPLRAAVSHGFTQLLDSVVRIDVNEVSYDEGAKRFEASIGSGVVLSADGLVLTNAHVASPRAVEIHVTLPSLEQVDARLVGWDHWTDLALLRLDMADVRRRRLSFAHSQFGDSDKLFPGETVYAVGTPFGLTRTVTRGIISNTHRYFEGELNLEGYETGNFNTWLQTDAAINPGNSGGPLVTEDGRIIGITSRGYLGANNLGFAIPANVARTVVDGLVRRGEITRSYIGIEPKALQDLENFYALALNTGTLINNVEAGSPAARAGLRVGDILLAINGSKVDGRFPEQLPPIQNFIASQPVGSTLVLTVKRGTKVSDVRVTTERLESSVGEECELDAWGLSVRKVSRIYARQNQLADDTGVVVVGVQPGFPADAAGLASGDIITKIDRQPLVSLEVIKRALAAYAAKPGPTLFEIERDRRVSLNILKP
ncbi:MAG TPA: trypsin-like peptidase domain-containing protein [Opitutaceae bacterium]|nr:trypsin-like peptidase domain-containing protein [Opitutaceae bacterium]